LALVTSSFILFVSLQAGDRVILPHLFPKLFIKMPIIPQP
jgi:hypothetical protein